MKYLILILFLVGCKSWVSDHDENMDKMALTDACRMGAVIMVRTLDMQNVPPPEHVDPKYIAEEVDRQCADMYWSK